MARRTEWYEEQAAKAPWRGKVNGREAYIDRWKGKWEICCRVSRGGKGLVMFRLDNRAAIRNLSAAVSPPLPEALLKKAMKAATRDVPIRRRNRSWSWIAVILILAAIAYVSLRHPEWLAPFTRRLP